MVSMIKTRIDEVIQSINLTEFLGDLQYLEVGTVNYAYYKFGSGDPLILVMGFAGTMSDWDPRLLMGLAETYTVIIFDNQGVGKSTDTSDAITIGDMALSTIGLVNKLDLDKPPHVLAWSMGGEIALTMAINDGDKIDKLVIVGSDPGGEEEVPASPCVREIFRSPKMPNVVRVGFLFPQDQIEATLKYTLGVLLMPDDRPTQIQIEREYATQEEWCKEGGGIYDRLPSITNPVYLIVGEEDLLLPAENTIKMANQIPNAQLKLIPDAGHGVLFQDIDESLTLIDDFLKSA